MRLAFTDAQGKRQTGRVAGSGMIGKTTVLIVRGGNGCGYLFRRDSWRDFRREERA